MSKLWKSGLTFTWPLLSMGTGPAALILGNKKNHINKPIIMICWYDNFIYKILFKIKPIKCQ